MDKQNKRVYLRQGEGEDEMYMAVNLPAEVASKMAEIRKRNPQEWKNRDLDLLREAREELKERGASAELCQGC